jgi:multicomponent Na+:H+ antiporter subunit D
VSLLLILPIVIPLASAALALLAWRSREAQRALGVAGTTALLGAALALLVTVWQAGIQTVQIGSWPAPVGIILVADLLGAIMVALAALMGLIVAVYSLADIDSARERFGYYPLLQILLMGVCGAFLTGDLFNLYVWFEVMLIASFVLLTLGGERAQMEGGIKYVTLNLLSSALFLAAVGILYGATGTLNLAALSLQLGAVSPPALVTVLAMLFLVAFGIKAAVFPLFFWLPASYHTPPVAVSAIFAGLLTKVGVYALIRVFTLLFVHDVEYTHTLLLIVAGLTMTTGVLGAVAQDEFRRALSFQIVSHIGYMLMGLALFTPLALAGTVFYIVHHIIGKTTLFLVSGVVQRRCGTPLLREQGGLYQAAPAVAVLFLIPALSLAGLPPLPGFFAKLVLVQAGLAAGQYAIVGVALGASLVTLFVMMKIWSEAFWKPLPKESQLALQAAESPRTGALTAPVLMAPIVVLVVLTVGIGLAAEPTFVLALRAAEQLLDPGQYVQAVLGARP